VLAATTSIAPEMTAARCPAVPRPAIVPTKDRSIRSGRPSASRRSERPPCQRAIYRVCHFHGPSHSVHGPGSVIMETPRNDLLTCNVSEPPIGIEPMTYALRGTRDLPAHASCTDSTGNRTDRTGGAGIIRRPGPRTGPRPRSWARRILLLCVNAADDMDPHRKQTQRRGRRLICNRYAHGPVIRRPDLPK